MPETGLEGPAYVSIETEQGPKIFHPGVAIDPARMRESWFVVWWAGADSWTNWDAPCLLTLQHRPTKIRFDTNGLHFTFSAEAGYAALMPLYGHYKALQFSQQSSPLALLKEKKKRVLTWEWQKALPADPLARARYWASALREFPIANEESFCVDRAHDSVTIQQSFRWLSWNDDWNTKHLKLAPINPVLAFAFKEGLAAEFSEKPFDMEIFTHHGPLYGIEGVDSYRVGLPALGYVHETAGVGGDLAAQVDAPCFQAWQKAHASGNWQLLAKTWPNLRDEFRRRSKTSWPAFASAEGRVPLEQTADALGASRIAYRLGDMDLYASAAEMFARSLVQLWAQQRGMQYFREHQPWRSMEPLGSNATLAGIDFNGWRIHGPTPTPDLDGVPDLDRIWRGTSPVQRESGSQASGSNVQRLIPGGPPTSFLGRDLPESVPQGGLVQKIITSPNTNSVRSIAGWPRVVWPDWKTPTGAPWNFGQVIPSTNIPIQDEKRIINSNTRVTIFSTR